MRKNVAGQKVGGEMVSATDGSAFTGAVTVYVTGDAGTQAAGSVGAGACTHEGQGFHTYAPAQAETNYDHIAFTFIGTGAVPATIQVYPAFPQTGDTYALANGASGFSAIKTVIDAISTTLGAAGAGLTATATAVWAVATRLLTAGTNIALAKGVGVTGLNDLDAAGVRTAVGLASANLDTQLADLPTNAELSTALAATDDAVLAAIATVQADTDNLQARIPAALVSGRMDSSVGAMEANTMTASALATDAVTEIQSGLGAGLDAAGIRAAVGLASANLDTQLANLPTSAELTTALASADDAVLVAIAALNNLSQASIRTAIGLASANLDTQLDALPTAAELATALGGADDAILAAIAALNNLSQANIRTAMGLASANLDTQLDALPTAGELTTALASADDAILAAIAALNNLSSAQAQTAAAAALTAYPVPTAAQINAEVVDAIATDTYAEPGQGAPGATISLVAKVGYLFKAYRNRKDGDGTTEKLYNDAGNVVDQKATTSEAAGVVTKTEVISGP